MSKRASTRRPPHSRSNKAAPSFQITPAQASWVGGLLLLGVALLTFLSFLSSSHGLLTGLWLDTLRGAFGWGVYVAPIGLTIIGVWVITLGTEHPLTLPWVRLLGALFLFVFGLSLAHHVLDQPAEAAAAGSGGGAMGYGISQALAGALGWAGALVILVVMVGIGLVLALNVSLAQVMTDLTNLMRHVADWLRSAWANRPRIRRAPPETLPLPIPGAPPATRANAPVGSSAQPSLRPSETPVIPSTRIASGAVGEAVQWVLPRVNETLAETKETQLSLPDIREKTRIIEETLRSLGVPVTVIEVNPGPVVTQFGLEPGYVERRDRDGNLKRFKVKISRISALSNDLALALAASPIRIEAPVPGKGIVGLEIPNSETAVVGLRGVMESEQFRAISANLAIAFGRDVSGAAVVDDLGKLPHLLIAGATGSGKSVCINALIASLLFRNTPDELKMLMVDPKRVELSNYNGIPHLIAPVVVEAERVVGVLSWVTREMDRRYKVFAKVGARNLQAYNELAAATGDAHMPFIVVFIDELADLMMVAPEEVERSICRIAQMARATGIHLVVATQRPSVDVVTGLIKANFPARISFAVSSQVDSRVVLDVPGAEKLIGHGDALYMAPDSPKLMRIQGCYVSDAELAHLVSFWKDQAGQAGAHVALPLGGALDLDASAVQRPLWPDMRSGQAEEGDEDPLLAEATAIVSGERRASVSFLQRRLRIGYSRAARLVDILEQKGIVGPATGTSKTRDVLLAAVDADPAAPGKGPGGA